MVAPDEPVHHAPETETVETETIDEIKMRHTPSVIQLQQDYQIWFQNQGEGEQQFTIPHKHPQM